MKLRLQAIADSIGARVVGDGSLEVSGISSLKSADEGKLVFAADETALAEALQSRAGAVIAGEFAAGVQASKPLLVAAQPRLAFARSARLFMKAAGEPTGDGAAAIHPAAFVHASARIGRGATIGPRAVLEENVTVGEQSRVGAGAVVGPGVEIGRECNLYPNVTIYPGCRIGDRVTVHAGAVLGSDGFGYVRDRESGRYEKFPQVGTLEIEDDVEIGANVTIDRGALETTRIGRGTKIDNLVHLGHNVQIGENVVIAAQTGLSGSVVVENDVVMGGQIGIGEHARIGEGVLLGGQSGVLPKKIVRGKGTAFWGTPAKPLKKYLKELASLASLAKRKE